MEFLASLLKPLGMAGVLIVVLNPLIVTIVVGALLTWLLAHTGLWRRHKRLIPLGAGTLYAVDAAVALPRIVYAWRSPPGPVVHAKAPLPATLVIVNEGCDRDCHDRLLSGELEEVILVYTHPLRLAAHREPISYRVGWSRPGACPRERVSAMGLASRSFVDERFCPIIAPAQVPADGIFIVREGFVVPAREKARRFVPAYLVNAPPGAVIEFRAVEVQRRAQGRIEVLAQRRNYVAPGLTGLPPLVGCWERPDNILWVMPPGDTGCGFWRWFTWGGDERWNGDAAWVYADVLTRTDRPVRRLQPPEWPSPNASEGIPQEPEASKPGQ